MSTTPLDKQFTAPLQKSPSKGGWTYVVMPGSADTSVPEDWSKSMGPWMAIPSAAPSWPRRRQAEAGGQEGTASGPR